MWYNLNFETFEPVSRLPSQFVERFSNTESVLIFSCILSISLNIFLFIRAKWKEPPPRPENDDWQGIWKGLGRILEPWGPAVPWDFTPEHLWDPEKLSQHLSQGQCGLDRSKEARLIWGLACAYRALYSTVLERDSFRAEVQAEGGNLQVRPDQSQQTPVTVSVAPVEGKKWKRVSSRLERKKEEEEEGEEVEEEVVEEDPGEGTSSEPRKAKAKTKRHEEDSDEEEISITVRRPLKMSEIISSRKEFERRPNETVVTWLLRCWDSGASSLSLDGNEARQLGDIAGDKSIDRAISRCLDEAATLWDRILIAVKERYPYKELLQSAKKTWNTIEKGIQYLREIALVEMLYDSNFALNDPRQNHDPERVRTTPEIWQKLTRAAPDRYAPTLLATFHRYEDQQRRPLVFELILTLQNYEQHLPPTHVSISAVTELANRLGDVEEQMSLLINRDEPVEPVIVSETFDDDQDKQRGLMKELIKLMKIQLIKEDGSPSSPVTSKISATEGKRFPARVRNNNRTASRVALWRYLRDHGEDMRKWHDQDTPVLRARVRELQNRPTTSVVAPVTTGNE